VHENFKLIIISYLTLLGKFDELTCRRVDVNVSELACVKVGNYRNKNTQVKS